MIDLKSILISGFLLMVHFAQSQSNNAIFMGTEDDGHSQNCFVLATNSPIFWGAQGDGHTQHCFVQQTNNSIFLGTPGDGHGTRCYIQQTNSNVFLGMQGDGYDQDCYTIMAGNSIFLGSQGDGYDASKFLQASNNSIFIGSMADGYGQDCGFADLISLPVEFLSFTGWLVNPDEALLNWTVAVEIDNAFFVLERATDGRNFEEVAIIPSLGNTTDFRSYEYLDDVRSLRGQAIVYYRLKQVDLDGAFEYSPIIALNLPVSSEELTYLLYPNPAHDQVFIRYAQPLAKTVQVELYDNLGRHLLVQIVDSADLLVGHPINLNHLPEGSYHLRIIDGDRIHAKTLMKTGL